VHLIVERLPAGAPGNDRTEAIVARGHLQQQLAAARAEAADALAINIGNATR
jgi:hypothetical protein